MGHTGQATVRSMEPDLTRRCVAIDHTPFRGATQMILFNCVTNEAAGTLTVDARVFYATDSGSHAHVTNFLVGQRWRGACSSSLSVEASKEDGKNGKGAWRRS